MNATIIVTNTRCQVVGIHPITAHNIDVHLSFWSPGAFYTPAYNQFTPLYWVYSPNGQPIQMGGQRKWDGKIRFFSRKYYTFPTGLLPLITQYLINCGYKVFFLDKRFGFPLHWGDPSLASIEEFRRPQTEALEALKHSECFGLPWPRGIIHHPGGTGKTETAAAIIKSLQRPALVLVDREKLLNQTRERFENALQTPVGAIGDGYFEPEKVTIATFQTIIAHMYNTSPARREEVVRFLATIDVEIIDEAHRTQGTMFRRVANYCDAPVRIGLSATILEEGNINDWRLMGTTGDLIHRVTTQEGMAEGWLAQTTVIPVEVNEPKGLDIPGEQVYDQLIVANGDRNAWFVHTAIEKAKQGLPSLVLVRRVPHGEILQDLFAFEGYEIPFLCHKTKKLRRERELTKFRNGDLPIPILLSSKIFGTGVDIQEIRELFNVSGGGSWAQTKQEMYRGMREKPPGQNTLTVHDTIDRQHPKLLDQSMVRFKMYAREGVQFGRVVRIN